MRAMSFVSITASTLGLAYGCTREGQQPSPQEPAAPLVTASATARPMASADVAIEAGPAPAKTALAIRQIGDETVCEGEGRCRFRVRALSAELEVKELESGAVVEYGSGTSGTGGPSLAALLAGIEVSPSVLGSEKNDSMIGARVAIRIRFQDGAIAEGKVPLNVSATRLLLGARLSSITDGPIPVPNDVPYSGKPRAMWVSGGYVAFQPRGTASTLAELDWILLVDDVPRKIRCPKGNSVTLSDTRGRVYERRTGKLVGERVFPDSLPIDQLCAGDSFLTLRSGEEQATWAWTTVRASVKGTP
jgi:hypothetical protein